MIAMIGSVLGFLGSFAPRIFSLFEQRLHHQQEMAMLKMNADIQHKYQTSRIEELHITAHQAQAEAMWQHDTALTSERTPMWVECTRALVRPCLTISILILYGTMLLWADTTMLTSSAFVGLEGMVAAVWSFWFGSRVWKK